MRSISVPAPVRRAGLLYRPPLPRTAKQWAVLVLAVPALVLAVALLGQVFGAGASAQPTTATGPQLEWSQMIGVVTRYGVRPVERGEEPGIDVLLATPQYFASVRRQAPQSATSEPSLLFYVTETTHASALPGSPPQPVLRLSGGETLAPAETVVLADSDHHRSTMVRYAVDDLTATPALGAGSTLAIVFSAPETSEPRESVLSWELPLRYTEEYASADVALGNQAAAAPGALPAVSGVALLAVFGGLLAAMWPCLFQLTAYFIPAMAGMSMHEASTATGLRPRVGVVQTAFFFVLGFTIVYTLAGAIIGFGSQQLSNMASFYTWQRYLSIGAGIILLVLALRVAVRARAPLVCKMPLVSRMSSKSGPASPWESMLVGITFATGCMTCFGSAILIGMVLYVGLAGSAVLGAGLLFLFSLGMGIPLVIGAMAMARVLPFLFRIEKVVPWMGLASAALIAGYGVLLITGNFMTVSGLLYQLLGLESPLSSGGGAL